MTRTILHADMDAFYAAVEAHEDPQIADRAIVVGADPRGGRGRGVVAACNYAAREYGIHSAMPISEAYRRCPDAVYLPVRMELYARVSRRIMAILETYTELVEKLSIDEAFLDVTGSARLFGEGVEIARTIKERVRDQEGLTVSIGVAPNKFLAKLASDLEKPDGLVVVRPGQEREFLDPLPISRLWGVGPKSADRLRRLGFTTIGDVAAASLHTLETSLGAIHARRIHRLAHGVDDRPVEPDQDAKQIGREITFGTDTEDRQLARDTLLALTEEVATRLRKQGVAGRTVTLKLRIAPFETLTRRRTGERPLDTTEAIFPIANRLFQDADPGDRPIRLIGVSVSGLQQAGEKQLGLFEDAEGAEGGARVAAALDRIRARFGRGAVRRGVLFRRPEPDDDAR